MYPQQLTARAERVDKYFVRVPQPPDYTKPGILAVGGGVLVLIGIITASAGNAGSGACLGLVMLIAGGVAGFRGARDLINRRNAYNEAMARAYPRATDEEMDGYLTEGTNLAVGNAHRQLKINPSGELTIQRGVNLLVFSGFPASANGFNLRFAIGDDNAVRASHYKILVVFATNYRFSTYECIWEMSTGATIADGTKEYHLQDVGGLETESNRISFPLHRTGLTEEGSEDDKPVEFTQRQLLRLMVSGQPAIEMVMGISGDARFRIANGQPPEFPAPEDMIHQLRQYLRDHKRPQQQQYLPPTGGAGLGSVPPEPLGM
ncbi:hypothetical protein [Actinoplanes sp. L3-i22]|uniref:hypothetical protein n=1 Tax=Actinoplanes sp. L3-i22 TaxID=2836373 RepID=UPI001C77BC5A|nr:hypothetical protein [Actinoplanes sp. L3-i22]BCY08067.1 hypothetical protein L3i22_031550 [Actinoplanes sp. L3-i22]